jgi:MinD superfamily P-loop ATPase
VKELTIISGKGGTGKTSLTAAFASLSKNSVFADCDVDAADLHLILKPKIQKTQPFYGLTLASLQEEICTHCMQCYEQCHFNAIDKDITIQKDACEGCGVCAYICPVDAIKMVNRKSGYAYFSTTRFGPMAHAQLKTAEEASGKLVTVVRNNAKKLAEKEQKHLIIIDGPPGIGCPVIASISGVDLVLIVTEPTLSAIHDLERIYGVAHHFNIPAIVCINKCNINKENTQKIKHYCKQNQLDIVGELPYNIVVTKAMIHEQTIIEYSKGDFSQQIRNMWNIIEKRVNK